MTFRPTTRLWPLPTKTLNVPSACVTVVTRTSLFSSDTSWPRWSNRSLAGCSSELATATICPLTSAIACASVLMWSTVDPICDATPLRRSSKRVCSAAKRESIASAPLSSDWRDGTDAGFDETSASPEKNDCSEGDRPLVGSASMLSICAACV